MKKLMNKGLSMILIFCVLVSGIAFPEMKTEAAGNPFGTNAVVKSNMDNGDGVGQYYWRGEEFEVSFDLLKGASEKKPTIKKGTEVNETDLEITDKSSVEITGTDYNRITKTVKIGEEASGSYTITFSSGDYSIGFTFTVYTDDIIALNPTTNQVYLSTDGKKMETRKFLVNANVKQMPTFALAMENGKPDDYLSISSTTSSPDNPDYKGCVLYEVVIQKESATTDDGKAKIQDESGIVSINLNTSFNDHKGDKIEKSMVDYEVHQAIIEMQAPKITSTSKMDAYQALAEEYDPAYVSRDPVKYLNDYPHIDKQSDIIFVDKDEEVEFEIAVKGGVADPMRSATATEKLTDYAECSFGTTSNRTGTDPDTGEEIQYYLLRLKGKKSTGTNKFYLTFRTESGNIQKQYQLVVYENSEKGKGKIECKYKNANLDSGSPRDVDYFAEDSDTNKTMTFNSSGFDVNETMVWSVQDTNIARIINGEKKNNLNEHNYKKIANGSTASVRLYDAGTIDVTAYTMETKTRPEGVFGLTWSISSMKKILPDKIVIRTTSTDNNEYKAIAVNTTEQLSKELTINGKNEVNYGDYTWVSNDESVATVDKNGKVTGLKDGTTTVYLQTNYSSPTYPQLRSNTVTIKVYELASKITVTDEDQVERNDSTQISLTAGASYPFLAKTDTSEECVWKITTGNEYAKIKPETDKPAGDTVYGENCIIDVGDITEREEATLTVKSTTGGVSKTFTLVLEPKIAAKSIKLVTQTTRLEVGKSTRIEVEQKGENGVASNEKLAWYVVESDGTLKSIPASTTGNVCELVLNNAGSYKIKVKSTSVEINFTLTGIVKATNMTLTNNVSNKLEIGKTAIVTVGITPSNATDEIEWSLNTEEATIQAIDNRSALVTVKPEATHKLGLIVTAKAKDADISKTTTITLYDSMEAIDVTGMESSYAFTNAQIKPDLIGDGVDLWNRYGNKMIKGTDYTITYGANKDAGKGTITFTGKGEYVGKLVIEFDIVQRDISDAVVADIKDVTYKADEWIIAPTVAVGTARLTPYNEKTKKGDYIATYTNNVNAGVATITIKGVGNYTGTATKQFNILQKAIPNVALEYGRVEYTGSALTPEVTLKDGKIDLVAGKDFTYTMKDNVNVGTATVTVTGIGNYKGEKEVKFTINQLELKAEMVSLNKTDFTYTGKNCKPKVTVKHPTTNVKLKANTDYTVTYPTDMVEKGIKRITITGTGNYRGTVAVEYGVAEKVSVSKASIKSAKNKKAKKIALKIKPVKNAEGYEILYSTSKKFTEDTTKEIDTTKTSVTLKGLKKGTKCYIKVRAYRKNSIGRTIYGSYSKVKSVKIKK